MNSSGHFLSMLKNPAVASASEVVSLLQKYPACCLLHMVYAKLLKSAGSPDSEKTLQIAALYCSDRKKLYDYLFDISNVSLIQQQVAEYRLHEQTSENEASIEPENDLISKFLQEKPVFKLKGEDALDEEEIQQEEPEIITEPMAEVYIRQGKTDKAIAIFKKLSLKYPEKSTYFAARIEKVHKKEL